MNERIRELAEQADCMIDKLGYGEGNLEKFAELIVKECMRLSVIQSDASYVSNYIAEHFGVKE